MGNTEVSVVTSTKIREVDVHGRTESRAAMASESFVERATRGLTQGATSV